MIFFYYLKIASNSNVSVVQVSMATCLSIDQDLFRTFDGTFYHFAGK